MQSAHELEHTRSMFALNLIGNAVWLGMECGLRTRYFGLQQPFQTCSYSKLKRGYSNFNRKRRISVECVHYDNSRRPPSPRCFSSSLSFRSSSSTDPRRTRSAASRTSSSPNKTSWRWPIRSPDNCSSTFSAQFSVPGSAPSRSLSTG